MYLFNQLLTTDVSNALYWHYNKHSQHSIPEFIYKCYTDTSKTAKIGNVRYRSTNHPFNQPFILSG